MRTRGGRALTLFEWRAGFHSQRRTEPKRSEREQTCVCRGAEQQRGRALEGSGAVQPGSEPFYFVFDIQTVTLQ